jgi:fucose permease
MAILASAFAPRAARRYGLNGVLIAGFCADGLSMALLAASPALIGSSAAFLLLCLATAALGLGFGAAVMALNTLVEGLSPGRADTAVLTLNALLGLGTALAPVLVAVFGGLGAWWALPLLLAILTALLLCAFVARGASLAAVSPGAASLREGLPSRFRLYLIAALLYGIVEALNGNWATLYLSQERHIPSWQASFALTAFWGMVTAGRVSFALLGRWLPARWAYLGLPIALALVFQAIAHSNGAVTGIAGFAAAGLACSPLLPLSISMGGQEFPSRAATLSGELIAFYQVGYGLAAFGVGPLRELGGVSFSTVFSIGSLAALALAGVAWQVVHGSTPTQGSKP